ncbi:MAG: hypothetical protein LBK99_00700, partial [Opitutaceae bacterium]|nr:hypothetical protein [Opitutaceae bacterium]
IAAEIAAGSPETIATLCGRHGISPNAYYSLTLELGIGRPQTRVQRKRAAIHAALMAIEREVAAGSTETIATLAARHGVAFWTAHYHLASLGGLRALRRRAAINADSHAPVLKPSGGIL